MQFCFCTRITKMHGTITIHSFAVIFFGGVECSQGNAKIQEKDQQQEIQVPGRESDVFSRYNCLSGHLCCKHAKMNLR